MSAKVSTGRVRQVYRFIEAHRNQFSIEAMCKILEVAPSGDYEWLQQPISNRAQEDARLLRLLKASFVASHGIYGAPRATHFTTVLRRGSNQQRGKSVVRAHCEKQDNRDRHS